MQNEDTRIKKVRLFRSKMSLFGDTLDTLGHYLGITRQTLSKKIDGESDFTQSEMNMIKVRYQLTNDEYAGLFTKEVVRNES